MGYFLLERRNTLKQYRETRRRGAQPSGVTVLHTAENITDFLGPDPGAEGVARFIAYRNDPGSYHRLCDSDSTIAMAPWSYECWHDTSSNSHSVGLSAAVASRDWRALGSRGEQIVVRMALAARDYRDWLLNERGITIPPRMITRSQAIGRVPGFVAHGSMDPGRRSDPGRDFPYALFLATFADATLASNAGGTTPGFTIPTPGGSLPGQLTAEDDMYTDEDRARAVRTEEHAMAARQHASNAEANSHQALKLIGAHLEPTRVHAANSEANAYRALRLLETAVRDTTAAADELAATTITENGA